jgi:hypothetical protein
VRCFRWLQTFANLVLHKFTTINAALARGRAKLQA